MTAPAHQVLGLLSGMIRVDQAAAKAMPAPPGADDTAGPGPVDADTADAIGDALADAEARYGPVGVT